MLKKSSILTLTVVLVFLIVLLFRISNSSTINQNPEQRIISFEDQQNVIAVLDTGINFGRNILKNTKIAEYCFSESREQIQTLCSGYEKNKNILNSGKNCLIEFDKLCSHGTFVAGILIQSNPKINIVSYQVYSKLGKEVVLTHKNYLEALTNIIEMKTTKQINFQAINISWNFDEFFESYCDEYNPEMTSKVKKLNEIGIKVYASTGNNYQKSKIAYPACVSGIIPVSSKEINRVISNYANTSSLVNNFGESITRSINPDSDNLIEDYGTSFSVPQVIARNI
jgi:Subtilase family